MAGIYIRPFLPKSANVPIWIKKKQQRITMVLDSKKIQYETIDISLDADAKQQMRDIAGNEKQLPPYITVDGKKCGDSAAFESAVEDEILDKFLAGVDS